MVGKEAPERAGESQLEKEEGGERLSKQIDINYNKSLYMAERPRPERDRSRNSADHEVVKALVVWYLQKKGYEVYTEVPLVGGGVCDIFIPEIPAYVEVLHSETLAQLKRKTLNYPKGLTQIVVRCADVLPPDWETKYSVKVLEEILP